MNVEGGEKNCSDFRMCSHLSDYQLKINHYKNSLVYKKHMVGLLVKVAE